MEPVPGGGIDRAQAELDTPYGTITSAWRIHDGAFHLTATVPPGTTATVRLPDGRTFHAPPGTHTYRWAQSRTRPIRERTPPNPTVERAPAL
ncbi:alpha-L-rhamnosidase C-terminal domain-containing protein [Yinghuangia sp. YIM S09857]|uniref:alpha-L-rhamnosidase C-terminal domain-containing protein n=1 Tax=Yinghuangia sp. YIM S09857 TaxID=3436929 RepID=UPI003F531B18